jgi:hypothetical protein
MYARPSRPHSVCVTVQFWPALAVAGLFRSMNSGNKIEPLRPTPPTQGDLPVFGELLEAGEIRARIGRRCALAEFASTLCQSTGGRTQSKPILEA